MEREQLEQSGAQMGKAIVLLILVGGIGSAVLGIIYGSLIAINPIIYLNVLAVFAFGGIMGLIVNGIGEICKVEAVAIKLLFSLLLSAIGIYFSYVFWLKFVIPQYTGNSGGLLCWEISMIRDWLRLFAETGLWGIGDMYPKGMALWAIWVIEALGITVSAVQVGVAGLPESD